jgi:hypothetical protein
MSESQTPQEPAVTISWGIDHYAALAGLTPAPVVEGEAVTEEVVVEEEVVVVEEVAID